MADLIISERWNILYDKLDKYDNKDVFVLFLNLYHYFM